MFAASAQAVNSVARDRLSAHQRLLGIRPACGRAGFQAALVIDDIAVPTDDRDVARHAALDSAELLRPGTPRAIATQSGEIGRASCRERVISLAEDVALMIL